VAVRMTPTVSVVCGSCGDRFELSRRNEYEHRRLGRPRLCSRYRHSGAGPSKAQVAAAREWWLDSFTLAELGSWPHL